MTEFTKLTPSYQGGEFAKPEHVIEVQEAFAPIESELADHERRVTAAEMKQRLLAGDPIYRLAATNQVMASPPEVTSASSATITAQVIDLRTDPRVRWVSGQTALSTDLGWIISRPPRKADGTLDVGSPEYYLSCEFMLDAAAFELRVLSLSTKIVVTVDGYRHSATQTTTDSSGSSRYIKFDFSGRRSDGAPRRIQITAQQGYLKEVRVAATDTLYPVQAAPAPMLALLGDSYATSYATRATASVYDGYPQQLARLLGFRSCQQNASSNTGFLATSAPYGTYASRVADVIALGPDLVLAQGSINDEAYSPAAIGAEAQSVFEQLVAGLPGALIVATGVLDARNTASQTGDPARNAAIESAAAAAGVHYIDTDAWVTGSGKAGSTTGDGNADVYTYSDAAHPTTAGGLYFAARIAGAISLLIRGLA